MKAKVSKKAKHPKPAPEPEEEEEAEEDLALLGEQAGEGDTDAQARLEELCDESGIDPETIETWQEVATLLANGAEEEEEEAEEEEEEEEEIVPEKDEVYFYKPPGKRKAVEVEVSAVVKSKKMCSLKDLENEGRVYKSVPWAKLLMSAD